MAEYATSIEIDAEPATVFDYLTTEAGMTAWMGQHAELDPRPGGCFAVDIAGFAIRGQYFHVERPKRVVVSWGVAGNPNLPAGASTVEFTLTPIERGTRIDLLHSELPDAELDGHADGWTHFLSRLRVAAPGGDAGPDDWRPIGAYTPSKTSHPAMKEHTMTQTSAIEIVQDYHRAWTSGDVDQAMTWVADDIICRAPGDDLTGKEAYREFLASFAPALTGLADIASFADGDRVALFYYPQTATTTTAPAAECFTIRDARIVESVLVFDRLSFGPPSGE